VTSPTNHSSVVSPVNYAATATTTMCARRCVDGIYVNNQLNFVSSGAKLNTALALTPGTYDTVVQEWDYCGGVLSSTSRSPWAEVIQELAGQRWMSAYASSLQV